MVSRLIIRGFSKVNYYDILGVIPSAKPNEVKHAYRKLVKELHPDVTGAEGSQEKFRLVTEAYTVLSQLETRATYDLTRGSKDEIEQILSRKRDKDGLDLAKVKYAPHQYGYKRLKEMAEERKLYNIDNFYRYRGGVPQKHLGAIRGNSYGIAGSKADVYDLNFVLKGHNMITKEMDYVDNTEAHEFKLSKAMDADALMKTKPFLRAEIDYDFTKLLTFKKHFLFYLSVVSFILFHRFYYESFKFRLRRTIRIIQHNAESSAKAYKKAGMKAVSLK